MQVSLLEQSQGKESRQKGNIQRNCIAPKGGIYRGQWQRFEDVFLFWCPFTCRTGPTTVAGHSQGKGEGIWSVSEAQMLERETYEPPNSRLLTWRYRGSEVLFWESLYVCVRVWGRRIQNTTKNIGRRAQPGKGGWGVEGGDIWHQICSWSEQWKYIQHPERITTNSQRKHFPSNSWHKNAFATYF